MRVTDIELIPVSIPTRPLEEELGLAPYVGGPSIADVPAHHTFEEALAKCQDVGTARGAILVRVDTDAGISGWGEMPGPLNVARAVLDSAIEPALVGEPVWDVESFVDAAGRGGYNRSNLPFVGGVEMALWDALGKEAEKPVYQLLGGKCVESVPIAFCLGLLTPENSREKAQEAADHGFSVLKTKASRYWRTDVERVRAMHDAVDGALDFRVDPNRQWGFEDAVRVGAKLEDAGIHLQYLEQPIEVNSFDTLATLRERLTQPIAINEDAYIPQNIFQSVKRDAVDAAVVDLQPVGGISRMRRLAALALESNISLAHHSGHDLGLKNAAKAHLAAATPELNLALDSTYYAAEGGVLETPLPIEDGRMPVPDRPGLAGPVDEAAIDRYRTD